MTKNQTQTRAAHAFGTLYDAVAAIVLAGVSLNALASVRSALQQPLSFDDSYMFARYAQQLRAGHGFSWNADGVHTYGPTSLLWAAAVWVESFLPGGAWPRLVLLSFACAVTGMIAMAWAVAANMPGREAIGSSIARRTYRVLPWVALPLEASSVSQGNQSTGMETMLAMALCAAFAGAALLWRNGRARWWPVAALGVLLYLARPEGALVALGLPVALWFALPVRKDSITSFTAETNAEAGRDHAPSAGRPHLRSLLRVLGATLAGIIAQLAICRLYFGTAVPLSVYMKGHQAYVGYRGVWHPELLLAGLLLAAWPFLALLLLFARGRTLRIALCCLAPAAAIFLYLQTVTQIMGFHSRYYAPYLPLIVIPALLALASAAYAQCEESHSRTRSISGLRIAFATALLLVLATLSSEAVQAKIRHAENRAREEYDAPTLTMRATQPLPTITWQTAAQQVTDLLVRPLPAGSVVAATEVGYLGERAPQVDIIDLAGLNDTAIALHGYSPAALLARKPDVIWLPNTDYTFQRGQMLSDPHFLQQYNLYAGAANYGIALRRDSPHRAVAQTAFDTLWTKLYPGYNEADYRVTATTWTGAHHTVRGE